MPVGEKDSVTVRSPGNVLGMTKTFRPYSLANRRGAASEQMRAKLRTAVGEVIYRRRKAIVEPVFAYIKDRRGFRRFSFRGLAKVSAEWAMICLTHNLLKLFRARACPRPA